MVRRSTYALARRPARSSVRRSARYGLYVPPAAKWAIFLGLGAAALALIWKRGAMSTLFLKAVGVGRELAFAAALPPGVRMYSVEILTAARKYNVSPWLIAGVMYRESGGGTQLRPPGPSGTGDFLARSATSTYMKQGYGNPATGLPPDGLGWGRGLMQIDYGAHNAWVQSHNWQDPQTNIDYAASLLAGHQNYFASGGGGAVNIEPWRFSTGYSAGGKLLVPPWSTYGLTPRAVAADPRPLTGTALAEATLAAYNAGRGGVLQALAVGLSPAKATAHGDYADWILSRVAGWLGNFN